MTSQEITEIVQAFGEIDLNTVDMSDQARAVIAYENFAKAVKPLVVKYSDKLPEKATFLMKM